MIAELYFILAILSSLLFWGLIRSAIWIFLAFLWPEAQPLLSLSLLTFFLWCLFLAPYKSSAFDLSALTKNQMSLLFFLTGATTGGILYPLPVLGFGLAAIFPLLLLKLYELIRFPVARIYYFPKTIRLIYLAVFLLVVGGVEIWEIHH